MSKPSKVVVMVIVIVVKGQIGSVIAEIFPIWTNVARINVVWTNFTVVDAIYSRCSQEPTFKVSSKSGQ